jgi:Metallo-peptidase family M12
MKRYFFRSVFLFVTAILLVSTASAGKSNDNVWQETDDSSFQSRTTERLIVPKAYKTFSLNKANLRAILDQSPMEFTGAAQNNEIILTLPMPDGSYSRFRIEKSPIVEAGLSAKYPELGETYRGQGIDDPTATVRFDFLPSGFHSMILSARGTVLVDPYFAKGDTENYISYLKMDAPRGDNFICGFRETKPFDSIISANKFNADDLVPDFSENVISGTQLRTYRLALAATQEYTAAVGGGTVAGALAAQVLIMNRVNGVYERDVAIRMVIVANNDQIVFTAEPDGYTNNSGGTMLSENQTKLDTVIGSANYDIGHVFSTGGGGVAFLGVPCGGSKAGGVTGLTNPVGDAFAIDYVAHEMGHQWGANHTFNGAVSNCGGGNRSSGSAYEPGSGVTIMAYAGICGNQDLARNSIDTFHVKSLEVIIAYSQTGNGNTCAVTTSTGNTPPTATSVGGTSFNIPKETPFTLTASGTDVNGDSLTYDWQEYDLGASTTTVPNTDSTGVRPILRPYLPTVGGTRTFPSLQYILNNANVPPSTFSCGRTTPCLTGELLPSIARTMNFQAVVRDNRASGGGINTVTTSVIVDGASGPFAVTSPNTATTLGSGSTQTITWNVNNTTAAPVSAANVKISLSTDGGQTFPTVLSASTPNDGTQAVTLPSISTTTARIKIEAVGNIFFDINDVNFTIGTVVAAGKPFDFDGDGKADISVYRGGNWYLLRSTAGFAAINFGLANDKTVAADYDGDGKTDVAIFRDGTWVIQNSSNGAVVITNWGQAGDIPMVGDYDGDNKADFTVFRNGVWYIQQSSNGSFRFESFGLATDKPVVGNFDSDNKQDLAVFRNGIWYVQGSQAGFFSISFGQSGDIAVPADFDGDNKTDAAVYRSGVWYILGSTAGFSAVSFGINTDTPTPADFDGDGKADVAVFRSSNGVWYLQQSTAGFTASAFGQNGDRPIPAQSR